MSRARRKNSKKQAYVDAVRFTPHFFWKAEERSRGEQEVYCEGVALSAVAAEAGTPVYVYSAGAIAEAYREFDRGLRAARHTICFAVKSNGNLAILNHLARMGSGFDIVSGGELEYLRRIGVRGERIVFSGVGKTREEMREALRYPRDGKQTKRGRSGIRLFNVESEAELEVLLEEAEINAQRGGDAPAVAVRVNPDVQAGGHPHIATGQHKHKFGVEWENAKRLYVKHRDSRWIKWQGISAHIGSQIVATGPFRRALSRMARWVQELMREGISLRYVDFGGGLGVRYTTEQPPTRTEYARMVAKMLGPLGVHVLLEPGRSIVAQAGVLLTRVLYTKENRGKTFVVTDAAMNDLMRPALYGAVHPITRIVLDARGEKSMGKRVDIVGPVCETGDCFLREWPLGEPRSGEFLAIWTAGAYGMAQASNYNARRRPAEVLVEGRKYRIIRKREGISDLMRGEVLE